MSNIGFNTCAKAGKLNLIRFLHGSLVISSFPPTAAGKNHIVSYMEELKRIHEAYSGKALIDESDHVVIKSAFKDPVSENLKKHPSAYFSLVLKTAKVGGKAEKLSNDSFNNTIWSKFAWVKSCSKEGCNRFLE